MNTTLKARLVLLAFAFLFTASVTHAQNFKIGDSRPITSLSVFDSKGKLVGGVLGFRGQGYNNKLLYPLVAIKTGGALLQMGVKPSGLVDAVVGSGDYTPEYYESTNCSGTPYSINLAFAINSDNLFTVTELVGTKVFAVDGSLPPKIITVLSALEVDGCHSFLTPSLVGPLPPVKMIVDLSTLYTPPFTIK